MATVYEQQQEEALSVSDAVLRANRLFNTMPLLVEGEVSELSNKPGYKAVYFTIKDEGAILPCMMWVNKYQASGVNLKLGALVRVKGKFSLYAPKGRLTFDVSSLASAGVGDLRQRVALLAKKLAAEGLTDQAKKRPLPAYPQVIGLVTSPRGAAVHDVLRTLRRRFPLARVVFAGVPVEGVDAPRNLIAGLHAVCEAGAEVALVVRGGGSFEDLMPFNDEGLARAIAACPVPVVTGIGHEPDTTIADLVADVRASTPTHAAEKVSPGEGEVAAYLKDELVLLARAQKRNLETASLQLSRRSDRPLFKDADILLSQRALGLDLASERLTRAIPSNITKDAYSLDTAANTLQRLSQTLCQGNAQAVDRSLQRMTASVSEQRVRLEAGLSAQAASLNALSPLAVLGRGYSIAYDAQGRATSSAAHFEPGDDLRVRFADGSVDCKVESVLSTPKEG